MDGICGPGWFVWVPVVTDLRGNGSEIQGRYSVVKVLVADDNLLTTSLLQTLFEMEGFEVICVNDGPKVVSSIQEHEPDVILMDYHLGSIEGTTLIPQIRDIPKVAAVPIVVFSGADKAPEALAAGADRFVGKPFEPTELVDLISELV